MKVRNKSKRLICLQTKGGRVDLLPGKETDDDRLDSLKDDKVLNAMIKAEDIVIVSNSEAAPEDKKTKKDLLIDEATELGIDTTDMTVAQLQAAIKSELEKDPDGDGL